MEVDYVFVFDNIVRDLPSVALISYMLKHKGYKCDVIHLTELNNYLKHYEPKVVVLNKPFLNNYNLLFKQIFGMKVCVLHTEGAMGARFLEKSKPKIDLYFFWNSNDKILYSKRNPWDRQNHPVVGCQRTDFLFAPLLCKKKNLVNLTSSNDKSLIVSLASPGGYAGLNNSYIDFKQKQINKLSEVQINLREAIVIEDQVADLAQKIIQDILASDVDLTLLFKPHPNENIEVWRDKLADMVDSSRLIFVEDHGISEILSLVDVHICAGHCQTLSEAMIMDVYALGFNPPEASDLFDSKWMSIGAPHFLDSASVIEKLRELHGEKMLGKLSSLVENQYEENKSLIDNFFELRDGNVFMRCVDHLECIRHNYSNSFSLSGLTIKYVLTSFFSVTRRYLGAFYRKHLNNKVKITRHMRQWNYKSRLESLYNDYEKITNDNSFGYNKE